MHKHLCSVQLLSCIRLFVTPWTTAHHASPSITNSWSLPKPMSMESVMPPSHLILCLPLLLLPSVFPSIRVFSRTVCVKGRWTLACPQQLVKMRPSVFSATTAKFNSSWSTFSTVCPSSAPEELPCDFSLSASSCPLIQLPTKYSYLFGFALATFFCASTDTFAVPRCSLVFSAIVCCHGLLLLFILKNSL